MMRKLVLSMFALFGFTAVATAQTVSVTDVEALPGETVTAILNLEAPADTYTGSQIVLQFPTAGFSVTKDVATGWSGSINNNAIEANGQVKIVAAGNETFTDAAISLEFTVDGSLNFGEYDVTVSGQFEGPDDGFGNDIITTISEVTFKVNVVSAHSVVLDENATTAPAAASGVNVRVLRTINANTWSTICLPFAMTENQVKAAFGDDVALGDFDGIETTFDENNIVAINVKFNSVTAIEANHPYIIKVSSDIPSFTVDGVDIAPEDEPSVNKDEYRTGTGTKRDPYVYHYNSFVGTYVSGITVPNLGLFLNGNKYYYSKGETSIKAYRAYFDFYDVLSDVENAQARVMMSFSGDGNTTNIDPRTMETIETGKVYNMAGQYVGEAEDADRLPKGIYIVNGKKKVIK